MRRTIITLAALVFLPFSCNDSQEGCPVGERDQTPKNPDIVWCVNEDAK